MHKKQDGPQIWPGQFVEIFENRTRTLLFPLHWLNYPHLHYYQTPRRHMPEDNLIHRQGFLGSTKSWLCKSNNFSFPKSYSCSLQMWQHCWRCSRICRSCNDRQHRALSLLVPRHDWFVRSQIVIMRTRLQRRVSQYTQWLASENLIGKTQSTGWSLNQG